MYIELTSDQAKLISVCNRAGHTFFIEKDALSALARNNGLSTTTVRSFTANPDLSTADNTVIHLPSVTGYVDQHRELPTEADKNYSFNQLLVQSKKNVVEVDPNGKQPVFFKIDLEQDNPVSVPKQEVKPLKKEPNHIMNKPETLVAPSEHSISIPKQDPLFVPFGIYNDVETIIKSGIFHPVFVTGLSGNGKTLSSMEACARLGRKCVRVPITVESDEDALLGGFRLIDGNTVFQMGPISEAMLAGAVLILDEVDKASSKIMCLQPVLEGQPIYLKRINKMIYPKPGFNIIATANTKGQGSEKGTFVTSLVLDEAFLERFAVTFEQDYPDAKTETKILKMLLSTFNNMEDDDFIRMLIEWAGSIRKAYNDGVGTSVITTRRLTHIIKNFAIFGQDKHKSVEMAISRFDQETKTSMYSLWTAKCPVVSNKSFGSTAASTKTTFANDKSNRPF